MASDGRTDTRHFNKGVILHRVWVVSYAFLLAVEEF
jgi:hypothetical protein